MRNLNSCSFDMTTLKKCTKCGEEKPATTEWFRKDKRKRSGICGTCKACSREYLRKYYQVNKAQAKSSLAKYYNKNKITFIQRSKKWREENIDRYRYLARMSQAKMRELDPERFRKNRTKCQRSAVDELKDWYIKGQLGQRFRLRFDKIPQQLIDIKRKQIQLKRLAK